MYVRSVFDVCVDVPFLNQLCVHIIIKYWRDFSILMEVVWEDVQFKDKSYEQKNARKKKSYISFFFNISKSQNKKEILESEGKSAIWESDIWKSKIWKLMGR